MYIRLSGLYPWTARGDRGAAARSNPHGNLGPVVHDLYQWPHVLIHAANPQPVMPTEVGIHIFTDRSKKDVDGVPSPAMTWPVLIDPWKGPLVLLLKSLHERIARILSFRIDPLNQPDLLNPRPILDK